MEFNFEEIDYAVMEATGEVLDAQSHYRNKQYLIEDINNNEWISEETYNEINESLSDDIFQEASVDNPFKNIPLDEDKYNAYRYDFITHNMNWKAQMRVATYILGIYQASHKAKKGSVGMPLKDLIPSRSAKINEIASKLYDGKIETMMDLITFLKSDVRGISFAKIRNIHGFDHTPVIERDDDGMATYGKIPGNQILASFNVKLPEWPLDSAMYKCCVEVERLNYYDKKEPNGPKYNEQKKLVSDMMNIVMGRPYSSANAKALMAKTCFNKDKSQRLYKNYIFAEHLKLDRRNKPSSNELIKKISAMETTTELANANGESNNMACVEQIAKQFGFKKAY